MRAISIILSLLLLLSAPMQKVKRAVKERNNTPVGMDVSHHQSEVDWSSVANSGIQYVYIKATEGATFQDPMFETHRSGAHSDSLLVGAYHFYSTTSSPKKQFANFKSIVKKEDIDLIPMIDIEPRGKLTKDVCKKVGTETKQLADLIETYYGKKPLLYCSTDVYNACLRHYFDDSYLVCVGHPFPSVPLLKGKKHYDIWQYTDEGRIKGIPDKAYDLQLFHKDMRLSKLLLSQSKKGQSSEIAGIDVSHHQGNIDWKKVKEALPEDAFVYIKCTEGATYTDKTYKRNASEAKKQGFKVGGYHYFRMTSTPKDQFKNFKKALDNIGPDLIPIVDVENGGGKSKAEIQKNLKVFLNLLEKEYGVKPMIYGTQRPYNTYCAPEFNTYPLYIGRYGPDVPVVIGPSHYTIWQYTDKGSLPGIPKEVDLCRFHPEKSIEDILLK